MFFVPIMVVIGVVNDSNLWLYLALALSGLGAVVKAAQAQAQKQAAAKAVTESVENLLKGIRATQN